MRWLVENARWLLVATLSLSGLSALAHGLNAYFGLMGADVETLTTQGQNMAREGAEYAIGGLVSLLGAAVAGWKWGLLRGGPGRSGGS